MIPTREKFQEVAYKMAGNISAIAEAFERSRVSVHNWINEQEGFADIISAAREIALDEAEARNRMLILGIPVKNEKGEITGWAERPDAGLIKFTLSSRGKKRGYGEVIDHNLGGQKNKPISAIVYMPDNGRQSR